MKILTTWSQRSLLLLLLLLLKPACGGGGGGGGGSSTPPPPIAVNFRSPLSFPAIASRTQVVYVRFNRDYDQATVNAATFTVTDTGGTVTGTLTFHHASNEIRWTPAAPLAVSMLHTVTLTVGITDTTAGPLAAPFVFTFTTGAQADTTRPTFTLGATGASNPTLTTIDLAWTTATDASAITYDIFLSLDSGVYDFTAPFTTTALTTGKTVTGLASNTTYYFVVRARDADDNTDLNEIEVTAKTKVSFSVDIYAGFMVSKCKTCHTTGEGSTEVPSMDYASAATTYATWFDIDIATVPGRTVTAPGGAKRVKSGGTVTAVNLSFVYNKVQSKHDNVLPWGGVGMPKTGTALSDAQLLTVYDWIFQGAPNN